MLRRAPINKEMTVMSMTLSYRPFALAIGLGLTLAGAALAQETAPEAPAEAPAEAPVTGDELSLGTPVGPKTKETAAVGEMYLAAQFEQWEQRCFKTEDGSDPCELYQLLKDGEGNSVAEISMFPLPPGGQAQAGATVIVPLETLLTANLSIAIDGTQPKIYPYTTCGQIGCVARIGFLPEEITQFKKGAKAVMTIVPFAAPDKKVELAISLKGFTAGFDAVAATAKPAN